MHALTHKNKDNLLSVKKGLEEAVDRDGAHDEHSLALKELGLERLRVPRINIQRDEAFGVGTRHELGLKGVEDRGRGVFADNFDARKKFAAVGAVAGRHISAAFAHCAVGDAVRTLREHSSLSILNFSA